MVKINPFCELFGQKGIGEGGAIGAVAAVTNAVNDALHQVGAEVSETPMTPRRILTAIQEAKIKREGVGT